MTIYFLLGLQGDYEKAGLYYMASVKEINKPHEFVFPYYGSKHQLSNFNDFILYIMWKFYYCI